MALQTEHRNHTNKAKGSQMKMETPSPFGPPDIFLHLFLVLHSLNPPSSAGLLHTAASRDHQHQ